MSYKIKLFTRRFECHCIVEMQQKGFKKKIHMNLFIKN